jgi:hypothetical protein
MLLRAIASKFSTQFAEAEIPLTVYIGAMDFIEEHTTWSAKCLPTAEVALPLSTRNWAFVSLRVELGE